ncbi:hypothetical protein [Sphingomonas sp. MS122]|uniref:hypothetical protein n=1 Tax=Sphingomonas sp. MS122 TaxID=3412683 RepID=UPI003C2B9279
MGTGPGLQRDNAVAINYLRRMRRGCICAAGFAGLLLGAAHARTIDQKPVPIDYTPASCATGRLAAIPKISSDGIAILYRFAATDGRTKVAPVVRRIEEELGLKIRYIDRISAKSTLVTQSYHLPKSSDAAINELFNNLCSTLTRFGFDIDGVEVMSAKEFERTELHAAEERRKLHRRYRAVLDEPQEQEIGELLRADWENEFRYIFFPRPGVVFSRVRENDVECRFIESRRDPRRDHISCEVGVLGTSSNGPEYGKGTLRLIRSENYVEGKGRMLIVYDEGEEVVIT